LRLGQICPTLLKALKALEDRGVAIQKLSGLWQSPSWPPGQGHPDYLNGAAQVDFEGTAAELLDVLMDVEQEMGRERSKRNAPRTLDLDILDFKGEVSSNNRLTLPHPRMLNRGFVLFPLQQIAPNWADPKTHRDITSFIAKLPIADVAPMKYVGTLR